jgi:heme exporter protein D
MNPKVLNHKGIIFGLSLFDFGGGLFVFLLCNSLLPQSYGSLAMGLGLLSLVLLVPIRLNYRRHILRDLLSYVLPTRALFVKRKKRVLSRN